MAYTKEDLKIDEEWLRDNGIATEEVTTFLIDTITNGFQMTRREYANFINLVK